MEMIQKTFDFNISGNIIQNITCNNLVKQALIQYDYKEINETQLAQVIGFTDEELQKLKILWIPAYSEGWIYLSDDIIYNQMTNTKSKDTIKDFINRQLLSCEDYEEDIHYKKITKDHDLIKMYEEFDSANLPNQNNASKQGAKKYYAITGETYEDLLMKSKCKAGKNSRALYRKVVKLAKYMRDYIHALHQILFQKQLNESKKQIQEKDNIINRANIINKELLDFKLMKEKNETVYVMSSESYAKQGLWKIGKTILKATKRLSGLNTSHPEGENIVVLKEIKTNNASALEKRCHWILQNLRPTTHKEWFLSSWNNLVKLLDIISNNMNEELEIVNQLVKEVHSIDIDMEKEKYIEGLDMNIFKPKETISITHEITENDNVITNTQTINIANLTAEQKKEKLINAITLFIRKNIDGMENFNYEYEKDDEKNIQIIWKDVLKNLMNICNIKSKSKILANSWKTTLRNIIDEAKCINSIKWK